MHEEKRSAIRKQISIDILVNRDFVDPRRWHTQDLAMDSVLVKMTTEGMLPGAWVDVVLLFEGPMETERLCLPAEIIRVSGAGVVLKFRDGDDHAKQLLREILGKDTERRKVSSILHAVQI